MTKQVTQDKKKEVTNCKNHINIRGKKVKKKRSLSTLWSNGNKGMGEKNKITPRMLEKLRTSISFYSLGWDSKILSDQLLALVFSSHTLLESNKLISSLLSPPVSCILLCSVSGFHSVLPSAFQSFSSGSSLFTWICLTPILIQMQCNPNLTKDIKRLWRYNLFCWFLWEDNNFWFVVCFASLISRFPFLWLQLQSISSCSVLPVGPQRLSSVTNFPF